MDSVLRKFRLKKERRESEARQKLKKELFTYNTCVDHGFPNKPSSIAYDPKLRLLAIGTKTGDLRIYGSPGVEFYGHHSSSIAVNQIYFLPGQARIITLANDNSLNFWEIDFNEAQSSSIHLLKTLTSEESQLKNISTCCLSADAEQFLIATDDGNIHILDVLSFKISKENTVLKESITQNAVDDFKNNPGLVVAVIQHPVQHSKFLIGYNRGLLVLWNFDEKLPEQTYSATQPLESISFYHDGSEFMTAHGDGSYVIWSSSDSARPKEQPSCPYGPFPCKAIGSIQWKSSKSSPYIIFSGGMPRASHGDRHTVSVMQGSTHVVFDLTSKVVDFVVLCNSDETGSPEETEYDEPHSLVILAEEEVVAIDLISEGWQTFSLPYLNSIHSSAILSSSHSCNVPDALWRKLIEIGESQSTNHTTRDWPINGGKNLNKLSESHDLLMTGHEDGSVRFWDVSTTSLRLLYKLSTSKLFGIDGPPSETRNQEVDDEWPPFRKVGTYDPFSDDPQLGIQKIILCGRNETLVLAGTAGQVIVLNFSQQSRQRDIQISSLNIVGENDGYTWKGHDSLTVKNTRMEFEPGFQPVNVVQLHPPAMCTSLDVHPEWNLLAVGTVYGYGLFDFIQNKSIFTRCTLSTSVDERASPRRKSLKKSLRESFRRLRNRRGAGGHRHKLDHSKPKTVEDGGAAEEIKTEQSTEASPKKDSASIECEIEAGEPAAAVNSPSTAATPSTSPKHVAPKPESRTDELTTSVVRCVYFADTFLQPAQDHVATLWVGTNAGTVYIHQITLPLSDKRDTEPVQSILAKEIQLKHGAPIISIAVLDRSTQPVYALHQFTKVADMTSGHQVVICSEEQFKIFSLPSLKPSTKYKFLARDCTKIRKATVASFTSRSDENYVEHDLVCLTNSGQLHVFNLPQLRHQIRADNVRCDNSTVNASQFTMSGEGFFLKSPSEFIRFSLSARCVNKPLCSIELKDGARSALLFTSNEATKQEPSTNTSLVEAAPAPESAAAPSDAAPANTDDTAPTANSAGPVEGSNETDSPATQNDLGSHASGTLVVSDGTTEGAKLHVSEESSSSVVVRNVVSSRTVVTKTTNSRTSTDGGTVTETSTNVEHFNTGQVQLMENGDSHTTDGRPVVDGEATENNVEATRHEEPSHVSPLRPEFIVVPHHVNSSAE